MSVEIEKWVEFETEVKISVSALEIAQAMAGEGANGTAAALHGLNNIATFLVGIPDVTIAEMTARQRELVHEFLAKQTERYRKIDF